MKMRIVLPCLWACWAGSWAEAADEKRLVDINFDGETEGAEIEGAASQVGVQRRFGSLKLSPGKTIRAANKAARFEKAGVPDGCPQAHADLGRFDKGVLKLSWTMTLERYERGPSKPNAEVLFTARLLNGDGRLFLSVSCLGTAASGEGSVIATGAPQAVGRWKAGQSLKVEVALDLGANTYDLRVDGRECGTGLPVKRGGPVGYLQFGDGSGIGGQDGTFAALLDDVKASIVIDREKMLEVYRRTPPTNNPPLARQRPKQVGKNWSVPGHVITSWVGNTFGGETDQNGFGRWIQNGIAPGAFSVTPDGTVVAGVDWDEAGRCIGLYKDGSTNSRLVAQYDMRGGHGCWGFGSSNHAVAADGEWLYACNLDGHLMRFRWTPGDLESHAWTDQLEFGKEWVACSLSAHGGLVAALFDTRDVRIWRSSAEGFAPVDRWKAPEGARAMCLAPDGGIWFVAGARVLKVAADGKPVAGAEILDSGVPTAVSTAPDGMLVVCDNGPRQHVRFYDVSGAAPRLVKTFGDEGGLRSGLPGVPGPRKLYGLVGAGLDAKGNLYVGCCLRPSGGGTSVKAFNLKGQPLWDVQCHAFTDGYSFDPDTDGTEVVGVDELILLDLSKPAGNEWSLKGLTLDPVRYPDDPRLAGAGCAGILRRVGGRRLLYTIGMQSGGFKLFSFEEGPGVVAAPAGALEQRGTWAWEVDARGDIWLGDPGDRTIRRYRFLRWEGGKPVFSTDKPDSWPAPEGYDKIQRLHYDVASDTLYLGAFPAGVKDPAWGMVGAVLDRYDGWTAGKRQRRWRIDLPLDDEKLFPKAIDIAGDYAFTAQVKPTRGIYGMLSVFALADGSALGQIWPGDAVGGFSGWVDITHGIRAHRRKDGEYLILVEEDFRGKNILYRWKP
jgi:hypothetical protein